MELFHVYSECFPSGDKALFAIIHNEILWFILRPNNRYLKLMQMKLIELAMNTVLRLQKKARHSTCFVISTYLLTCELFHVAAMIEQTQWRKATSTESGVNDLSMNRNYSNWKRVSVRCPDTISIGLIKPLCAEMSAVSYRISRERSLILVALKF